ncbi:GntR family transcriptional regulator [Nesterenkonia halotolerans]|uniref:DNA-binding GntR family transcriptional regulator n=1 Tax=Nesterenkonia halotolerans TaxID=225325 RepID=A0ABR9J7W1_9MICC|nr:GntR family transcriptional regulator [Nesterenkonia halotolerans]MBE1515086.1 DNA-binding GntR family transcriptional regulator [Nesterenkonia halotolerans]
MVRVPEAQRVRDALENAIVDGQYGPGERLDPAKLQVEFGCSRTPVREALQGLERSGLVRIRPKQGTYVTELSIPELAERFELMAELEGMAARLASRRIEREPLAELRRALEECERHEAAGDADGYYYANACFHSIIYDSCGNGYLQQQAHDLRRILQPYRRLQLRAPDRMRRSLAEHHAIVEAISSGDTETAENTARDHVLVQVKEFSQLVRTWNRLREARVGQTQAQLQ